MTQPLVIEARGLEKWFGAIEAVRGIDLEVRRGEIFGFLGPNGAGKSTTINILCTLLRPTAGRASVAGFDVVTQANQVRSSLGLVNRGGGDVERRNNTIMLRYFADRWARD